MQFWNILRASSPDILRLNILKASPQSQQNGAAPFVWWWFFFFFGGAKGKLLAFSAHV